MARFLFAHGNWPAQFGAFGEWLAARGHDCVFLTRREGAAGVRVKVCRCRDHRAPSEAIHPYLRGFERQVIGAQAFARAALALRRRGFVPDVTMAHAGAGPATFLKDVNPETLHVPYFEWHYNWPNVDVSPWDEPDDALDAAARNRVRNAAIHADFMAGDLRLCPTRFQAAQFPEPLRERLTVMHDGIDTDANAPPPDRAILARWGVPEDAEVVTSITRGMEPHRGFPEIMRALSALMARRPRLHAFVGGEDRVAYGASLPEGESWKARMLAELPFDHERLHFTGLLTRRDMAALVGAADAHVYLTIPFVLSWSLLDAMSAGALIVASDTPPVREFLGPDQGLLAPMHDAEALAARLETAIEGGTALRVLREAARAKVVTELDATRVIWPRKLAWLEAALARRGTPDGGSRPSAASIPPA